MNYVIGSQWSRSMKLIIIWIGIFLLCSCASTSEVKDIEQLVIDGRDTITALDNKIGRLEADRTELTQQLQSIDNNSQSEASLIRGKISVIDQSIDSYKKEITVINSRLKKNSLNISAVKLQQKAQHEAAISAVKENEALKQQAFDEIKAIELEYEEKRKKLKEQNDDGE